MTTNIKIGSALLAAAAAAVVGVGFAAAQASASSAPIVITYEKTCVGPVCTGTAGNGGEIKMQVTGFRETGGGGAQLTMTEWITVGAISFEAKMRAHASPAGFIVLNGTITAGSYAGAQVHQRSNFDGLVGGDPSKSHWIGELQLMPSSG